MAQDQMARQAPIRQDQMAEVLARLAQTVQQTLEKQLAQVGLMGPAVEELLQIRRQLLVLVPMVQ